MARKDKPEELNEIRAAVQELFRKGLVVPDLCHVADFVSTEPLGHLGHLGAFSSRNVSQSQRGVRMMGTASRPSTTLY
jgi:hypothetical protein